MSVVPQITTTASSTVRNLLADTVVDQTPASVRSSVRVLYAPISGDAETTAHCRSVLSEPELRRADSHATLEQRNNFIQRRAFRRYCAPLALGLTSLAQIEFGETEKGRPYLLSDPHIWFSFSSCRSGILAAWSLTHAVGIDLEELETKCDAAELAREFFTEVEKTAVETATGSERQRIFLQLWCLKEAALKSVGEGLPFGLDAFEFELGRNTRVIDAPAKYGGAEGFRSHILRISEAYAALVIHRRETRMIGAPLPSLDA